MTGDDRPRYEPWLAIPPVDYEGHMSSPGVGQLAVLSDEFAGACARSSPRRVLVVGCATGNGLEHVDARVTRLTVGLDVNLDYLGIARERFAKTCPGLALVCGDVERLDFLPGSFDLIFAGLILEYVEPERLLGRMRSWISDGGLCQVVIQLPDDRRAAVTETGFESLRALAPVMDLLTAAELERLAAKARWEVVEQREIPLPNGKRFHSMCLRKAD